MTEILARPVNARSITALKNAVTAVTEQTRLLEAEYTNLGFLSLEQVNAAAGQFMQTSPEKFLSLFNDCPVRCAPWRDHWASKKAGYFDSPAWVAQQLNEAIQAFDGVRLQLRIAKLCGGRLRDVFTEDQGGHSTFWGTLIDSYIRGARSLMLEAERASEADAAECRARAFDHIGSLMSIMKFDSENNK